LRRAEDGKQGFVSRDEKQIGDKNQVKWWRKWKKSGQERVMEKKDEETLGKRKAKTTMLEPAEQQQQLDEKRPDHGRVVFVVGVDECSVGPTLLTSERLCVRPAWDSHALVPSACLPL
jgi:translation elongation factor EF-G